MSVQVTDPVARRRPSRNEANTQMARYEFGEFIIDLGSYELTRAGTPVPMPPRALDALTYLLENRERAVSRDELRREVWKVAALSASSVPTCIASLRQALDDDADSPKVIQTLRNRGYRFIAPVRCLTPESRNGRTEPNFVGRSSEQEALLSDFESACHGGARLSLVYGEPGIGKTTLVERFAAAAKRRNAEIVIVSIPETEGAPPLWAWVSAFRPLIDRWPHASRAYPKASELLNTVAPPPPEGTPTNRGVATNSEDRFRLFDSVTRFLQDISAKRPILVIFDDLHRADTSTINLLSHVQNELHLGRVHFVATLRSSQQFDSSGPGVRLARLPRTRGLSLLRLSVHETALLLQQRFGYTPRIVGALHERSGGNPFLLTRLIDAIEITGTACLSSSALPRDMGDAILQLTTGLSGTGRDAVAVAAVMGRDFLLDVVARALARPVSNVERGLAAACSAGIVEAIRGEPNRYRFVHLLVRDALYDRIEPEEQARTHLAVAVALEDAYRGRAEPHSAELAHHYFQAAHIGGAEKAVRFARAAATDARQRAALEDVPRYYRVALDASRYKKSPDAREGCQLMLELGEAELSAGARALGRAHLAAAAQVAEASAFPDLLARAALGMAPGSLAIEVGIYDAQLVQLLKQALASCGQQETVTRARLLARLSLAVAWAGTEGIRRQSAEEALAIARKVGEGQTLGLALIARHNVLAGPENLSVRKELTEELREAAEAAHDPDITLMHRLLRVTMLLECGRIGELDREIARYRADAEETRLPHFLWYVDLFRAMRSLMSGEFSAAAQLAESFQRIGMKVSDENAALSFGAHCALQLWETGRAAEAARVGNQFVSQYANLPAWDAAVAVFEADAGFVDRARARFSRLERELSDIPRNQVWTTTIAILSEACSRVGSRAAAARLYNLLLPGREQHAVMGFGVASLGPISRLLGLLAARLGRLEEAIGHLDDAIRQELDVGGVQYLLRAQHDLAYVLTLRGRPADQPRAKSLLSDVLRRSKGVGMVTIESTAMGIARRISSSSS